MIFEAASDLLKLLVRIIDVADKPAEEIRQKKLLQARESLAEKLRVWDLLVQKWLIMREKGR